MDFGLQLLQELDTATQWPLPREQHAQTLVGVRNALLRGDRDALAAVANWSTRQAQLFIGTGRREYVVDPLATLIAEGYADFLWGEDPEITPAGDRGADVDQLAQIVETSDLPAALWNAETVCAGEGETWWHVYVDRDVATVPLIEFASRLSVVPLLRGPRLMACALVTLVRRDGETFYRCAEVHSHGVVRHALWRGTGSTLGKRVALQALDETVGLEEEWRHGLPMLAGRILNGRAAIRGVGVSEYDRVQDLLLALNEARSIGTENARLTAKKRLFAAQSVLQSGDGNNATFNAGDDIIITDPGGGELGSGSDKPPITAVEYSFDAAPLIAHTQELERTILSRVRMVPQLVGIGDAGRAESGTAIRLRFLPTVNAANGKAREWDSKLPMVLQLAMLVDALPEEQGGFGRGYQSAVELPSVERADILPRDESEQVTAAATGVQGEVLSVETAVRDLHPEWTDEQVEGEVARIREDRGGAPVLLDEEVTP